MKKEQKETEQISERFLRICHTEDPLSADSAVLFPKGDAAKKQIWIFDVGDGEGHLELLKQVLGETDLPYSVVLSHFHSDHTGNLEKLSAYRMPEKIYGGINTLRYLGEGAKAQAVEIKEPFYPEDEPDIFLFPIPSAHAKGCAGLVFEHTWALTGDAMYSGMKAGKPVFNVNFLMEQIRLFESLDCRYICPSHRDPYQIDRSVAVRFLKMILKKRKKDEAYIDA